MDRVQRSGLIALSVLLLTAVGAHLVGSRPGSEATVPPRKAAQDPAALEGVQFLPPEQRTLFVGANDFVREPVRHPLTGVGSRNILAGMDEPPDLLWEGDEIRPAPGREPQPAAERRPTGPVAPRDGMRIVRARENDSLTTIARRELGDGSRWRELATLNGLEDPYVVEIGQALYVPRVDDEADPVAQDADAARRPPVQAADRGGEARRLDWDTDEPLQAREAAARTEPPAATEPAPREAPAPPRSYVVQPNETASEISQKVYGTARHWKKILAANGIADARDLKAGATLLIPPLD